MEYVAGRWLQEQEKKRKRISKTQLPAFTKKRDLSGVKLAVQCGLMVAGIGLLGYLVLPAHVFAQLREFALFVCFLTTVMAAYKRFHGIQVIW